MKHSILQSLKKTEGLYKQQNINIRDIEVQTIYRNFCSIPLWFQQQDFEAGPLFFDKYYSQKNINQQYKQSPGLTQSSPFKRSFFSRPEQGETKQDQQQKTEQIVQEAQQVQDTQSEQEKQNKLQQLLDDAVIKLKEQDQAILKAQNENTRLKEGILRVQSDMENLQQRTKVQKEESQKFALQKFLKELLDVADNLDRATHVVPASFTNVEDLNEISKEQLIKQLTNLLYGVKATDKILTQVLNSNGVERFNPQNQKFDPEIHNALFQVSNPQIDSGVVAVVHKNGYKLNGRVIRAAEVGVNQKE